LSKPVVAINIATYRATLRSVADKVDGFGSYAVTSIETVEISGPHNLSGLTCLNSSSTKCGLRLYSARVLEREGGC
jgi:hypothetical protein